MTLSRELRSIIPSRCYGHRPFVCDGLPQSCTVMVVGENSATKMGTDWWSYWSDERGFDLGKFERDYRALRPKRGGTRLRLEWLRYDHGLRCLETNVYSEERRDGHGASKSNMEVVRLLISRFPLLKVVVPHGEVAKAWMKQELPPGRLLPSPQHFRSASHAVIDALAAKIKAKL